MQLLFAQHLRTCDMCRGGESCRDQRALLSMTEHEAREVSKEIQAYLKTNH
jgi:hypothetical protein